MPAAAVKPEEAPVADALTPSMDSAFWIWNLVSNLAYGDRADVVKPLSPTLTLTPLLPLRPPQDSPRFWPIAAQPNDLSANQKGGFSIRSTAETGFFSTLKPKP